MSSSERVNRLLVPLLSLYIATVGIAAVYFNWEFARSNGFLRWVALGEIVPTAKAIVWPYFILRKGEIANPSRTDIEKTRLTSRQIAEMEVKKFILAINYSQQAAYLLNSAPHEHLDDYPNLQDILAYRRKAIEVGKSVDRNVLNGVYPELGDKFTDDFIEAMSLFVHGSGTYSNDELYRSKLLNDQWADWYQAHHKAIEDAANAAIRGQ